MFVVVVGSYALLKVLRTVGETALSVSRRNEAPLPKMRGWWVLTVSLGRCDGREGIIGSEVAMVDCSAGDDEKVGGAGCDDIVESIMGETCRTREPGGRRQRQCGGDPSAFSGQVQRSYLLMDTSGLYWRCISRVVMSSRYCVLRMSSTRHRSLRGAALLLRSRPSLVLW